MKHVQELITDGPNAGMLVCDEGCYHGANQPCQHHCHEKCSGPRTNCAGNVVERFIYRLIWKQPNDVCRMCGADLYNEMCCQWWCIGALIRPHFKFPHRRPG